MQRFTYAREVQIFEVLYVYTNPNYPLRWCRHTSLALSWGDHPKQFLPLVCERTMIQETLLRLKGLDLWAPIISCGEGHRFMVAQQIGEGSDTKPAIRLEPMAQKTAPAIAAACCAAMKQGKDARAVVLPSDHVIADVPAFQNAVKVAALNA